MAVKLFFDKSSWKSISPRSHCLMNLFNLEISKRSLLSIGFHPMVWHNHLSKVSLFLWSGIINICAGWNELGSSGILDVWWKCLINNENDEGRLSGMLICGTTYVESS